MPRGNVRVSITADPSGLKRGVREAETSLQRLDKSTASGVASAAKFAATSAGIASVGIAITEAATATVDFDKAMRNVNSIAQLSEKQLESLDKQVLKLAGKTAQAPETLANGLYDLVSSGFDAKESMEILASSAKAATAGLTTTEISTKAVAAVLNAYHRPAADAAQISDDLFQTVNRGVISFETLASSIGDVLPFASSLNIGLKPVGAAISTMTKEGLSGEEATTRLKNVMVALLKPSEDASKAIKKLGFDNAESLVKAKGFQGALEALIGTTDGSKAAVAKLFPNIRALGGALALTGINTKTAEGDLKAFQHTSGATDKALSQQSKSISYNWNKVKATFSAFSIEAGFALIKFGRSVANFVDKNREAFNQALAGARQFFHGFEEGVRGLVKIVSGLLTLNFKRAWSGVKDIVRGSLDQAVGVIRSFTAPFRKWGTNLGHAVIDGIVNAIKSAPGAVTDAVKSIIPGPVRKGLEKTGNLLGSLNPFGASGGVVAGSYSAGDIHNVRVAGEEVILNPKQQALIDRGMPIFAALKATGAKVIGNGVRAASGAYGKIVAAANSIDSRHYPYRWGGGHNSSFSGPYDCSGAWSAILHSAGLLSSPLVSGQFANWGDPGPGRVTLYANSGHVYGRIGNSWWGTSRANPGGGAGWFPGAPRSGFTVRHVPEKLLGGGGSGDGLDTGVPKKAPVKSTGIIGAGSDITGGGAFAGHVVGVSSGGGYVPGATGLSNTSVPDSTATDTGSASVITGVGALDDALGDIDLHVRAGDETASQGITDKRRILTDAINSGTFNGQILSPHDILELRAELGDLKDVIEDNTKALLELKTQQADNFQKLYNASESNYKSLFAGFVAAISGDIGGRTGLGFMSPSTAGRLASY